MDLEEFLKKYCLIRKVRGFNADRKADISLRLRTDAVF
jgi:hypothetical protein